jgi:hypothetical protein
MGALPASARRVPGQPGLPTRLVAGPFILKHIHDLPDEALCERWLETPRPPLFAPDQRLCTAPRWPKATADKRLCSTTRLAIAAPELRDDPAEREPPAASIIC